MDKKRKRSNRTDSEYYAIYDTIRNDLKLRSWHGFTAVGERPITRKDVDKIRSTITHNARRGAYGAGIQIETWQDMEEVPYTFWVRKIRKETGE